MPFDTTSDTTQSATGRNVRQPPAKKSAYLSRFCSVGQHSETGVGGLWLRRSRVRAPSVTLLREPHRCTQRRLRRPWLLGNLLATSLQTCSRDPPASRNPDYGALEHNAESSVGGNVPMCVLRYQYSICGEGVRGTVLTSPRNGMRQNAGNVGKMPTRRQAWKSAATGSR